MAFYPQTSRVTPQPPKLPPPAASSHRTACPAMSDGYTQMNLFGQPMPAIPTYPRRRHQVHYPGTAPPQAPVHGPIPSAVAQEYSAPLGAPPQPAASPQAGACRPSFADVEPEGQLDVLLAMGDAMNTVLLERMKSLLEQKPRLPSSEAKLNIYLHTHDQLIEKLKDKVAAVRAEQQGNRCMQPTQARVS